LAGLVPVAFAACGLEVTGLQDVGHDGGVVPTTDASGGFASDSGAPTGSKDANGSTPTPESGTAEDDAPSETDDDSGGPPPPPPIPCDASAGCYVLPTGWSIIAFASNQTAACPDGFALAAPNDLVESPTAGGCTCSGPCTVGTAPTCASGAITAGYDVNNPIGSNTCGTPASTQNNDPPGGCDTDVYTGSFTGLDLKFNPPPASGGQCSSPGQASGMVTYGAQDRACQPDSTQSAGCTGDACSPNVPAPYAACLVHGGNVACPAGVPFTVQHTVGSGATVVCTDCDCAITADCSGTVEFFTDTACSKGELDIGADGGCQSGVPASITPTMFGSYKYVANAPANVACTPNGTSTGTATLTHEQTICCLQ
jgi:hypothetical protein